MLLQHWKHFLNKTQQNQVLFFDPFANSEFPCAVLLWYMEILHRFPETQLLSTVQCSATKSGNRISMSLYFLNCYKSLSSLRKDESHVSSVSWCFKVRIWYLFCMHGAAHLISCLYFKDFFKLKYFSTLSFSSLTHWLSSEQQDGHMTERSQANWVCLCPEVSPLLQIRCISCGCSKTVSPLPQTHPLPFPFSHPDTSKPPTKPNSSGDMVWHIYTIHVQTRKRSLSAGTFVLVQAEQLKVKV